MSEEDLGKLAEESAKRIMIFCVKIMIASSLFIWILSATAGMLGYSVDGPGSTPTLEIIRIIALMILMIGMGGFFIFTLFFIIAKTRNKAISFQTRLEKERIENKETEAWNREETLEYAKAIEIWEKLGKIEEVKRVRKNWAEERESAKDYKWAIMIWEQLGEINEAARVRELQAEQGAVKVTQKVVHGDEVTKTEIKDSVVSKSNIGSGGDDKLTKIKELKELHDAGAIDDDEFKQMKKEILGK